MTKKGDDDVVIELYRKKVHPREIAKQVKLARGTVYRVIKRNGIQLDPTPDKVEVDSKAVARAYAESASLLGVARQFGVSPAVVARRVEREGGQLKSPASQLRVTELVRAYHEGTSRAKLARQKGVAWGTIDKRLREAGIVKRRTTAEAARRARNPALEPPRGLRLDQGDGREVAPVRAHRLGTHARQGEGRLPADPDRHQPPAGTDRRARQPGRGQSRNNQRKALGKRPDRHRPRRRDATRDTALHRDDRRAEDRGHRSEVRNPDRNGDREGRARAINRDAEGVGAMNDGWRAAWTGGAGVLVTIAVLAMLAMIGHERTTGGGREPDTTRADRATALRAYLRSRSSPLGAVPAASQETSWLTRSEARERIETLEKRVDDLESERADLARRSGQRLEEIHQRIDDVVSGRKPE